MIKQGDGEREGFLQERKREIGTAREKAAPQRRELASRSGGEALKGTRGGGGAGASGASSEEAGGQARRSDSSQACWRP